jgi:hypothetical protein
LTHIFDLEPEFLALQERCAPRTMTSIERMYALHQATAHIVRTDVPGDLVECGVWRGGSVMLMALTLLALGVDDRTIWLYDTFAGMTPPAAEDVQVMTGEAAADVLATHPRDEEDPFWGVAPRTVVEDGLRTTGYPMDLFRFVEGDVLDTLPVEAPDGIALLRLDTDWYASTRHELEHLYPKLATGGVLLVDDYGYWAGARRATDEHLAGLDHPPLLQRIDYTGRMGIKPA